MAQMNLFIKQKTLIENRLVVARVERGGSGTHRRFGVSRCKLLHLEWIRKKIPHVAQGNISNLLDRP